jgi:hypothetical protein
LKIYFYCSYNMYFSIAVKLLFRSTDRNKSEIQTKLHQTKRLFIIQLILGSAVYYLSENERWLSMRKSYKVQ